MGCNILIPVPFMSISFSLMCKKLFHSDANDEIQTRKWSNLFFPIVVSQY